MFSDCFLVWLVCSRGFLIFRISGVVYLSGSASAADLLICGITFCMVGIGGHGIWNQINVLVRFCELIFLFSLIIFRLLLVLLFYNMGTCTCFPQIPFILPLLFFNPLVQNQFFPVNVHLFVIHWRFVSMVNTNFAHRTGINFWWNSKYKDGTHVEAHTDDPEYGSTNSDAICCVM